MVYRLLLEHGAEFEVCGDASVAMCYPGNIGEADNAAALGIADLSPLPRVGLKGRDTPHWLERQGVRIPDGPNQARLQPDQSLVLRLSDDEHVFLGDLEMGSDLVARLGRDWQLEPDRLCYLMPRDDTHSWFALTGSQAPEMLAKVCAVDMRLHRFDNHRIAQTSVARTNGVVVRCDLATTPCFYILADSPSADFLWSCLLDAMQEFKGAPVGLKVLREICTRGT